MSVLKVFTLAKLCNHSVDNTKLLDYRGHWNVVRTCVTRGCAQCTMYNACSSVPCVSFYHLLMSSVTTIEQRHSNMQSIYCMWYRSKILTMHLYLYILNTNMAFCREKKLFHAIYWYVILFQAWPRKMGCECAGIFWLPSKLCSLHWASKPSWPYHGPWSTWWRASDTWLHDREEEDICNFHLLWINAIQDQPSDRLDRLWNACSDRQTVPSQADRCWNQCISAASGLC